MKTKTYTILTKPYIVVLVMLFAPLLNYFDRNFSYFFGLSIVLLLLWSSNYNWSLFGFAKKITKKTFSYALLLTSALIIVDSFSCALIDSYFGAPDYSSLEDIKHNPIGALVLLIVIWVFAAFGEELLFRGYYMKWLAKLLGNTAKGWFFSGIITALYFSISHYYQGISGVLSIMIWTLIISYIFYKNKENLVLPVFIHGLHDTWALAFLYLDKKNPITALIEHLILV